MPTYVWAGPEVKAGLAPLLFKQAQVSLGKSRMWADLAHCRLGWMSHIWARQSQPSQTVPINNIFHQYCNKFNIFQRILCWSKLGWAHPIFGWAMGHLGLGDFQYVPCPKVGWASPNRQLTLPFFKNH